MTGDRFGVRRRLVGGMAAASRPVTRHPRCVHVLRSRLPTSSPTVPALAQCKLSRSSPAPPEFDVDAPHLALPDGA